MMMNDDDDDDDDDESDVDIKVFMKIIYRNYWHCIQQKVTL